MSAPLLFGAIVGAQALRSGRAALGRARGAFPRPSLTLAPLTLPAFPRRPVVKAPSLILPIPEPLVTPPTWSNTAGQSGTNADHTRSKPGIDWSRHVDCGGLARFLRQMHPDKTAAHVAADTKLAPDTVKKWLAGDSAPNGRALLVLACTYGPEVMSAMLAQRPDWLDASVRQAQRAELERDLARLEARLGRAPAGSSGAGQAVAA